VGIIKIKELQDGYTIIEALIAMALVSLLLILFVRIVTDLFLNVDQRDMLTAINLAESALENCLIEQSFYDDIYLQTVDHRTYRIKRKVIQEYHAIEIFIEIFNNHSDKVICSLNTQKSVKK
jgi:competence protein ComGC